MSISSFSPALASSVSPVRIVFFILVWANVPRTFGATVLISYLGGSSTMIVVGGVEVAIMTRFESGLKVSAVAPAKALV